MGQGLPLHHVSCWSHNVHNYFGFALKLHFFSLLLCPTNKCNCPENRPIYYLRPYFHLGVDLIQLQKPQKQATRIVTKSSYDAPSKLLLLKLEWKSIKELFADETKMTVFKSLNDFGPKYMYKMFTKIHI